MQGPTRCESFILLWVVVGGALVGGARLFCLQDSFHV